MDINKHKKKHQTYPNDSFAHRRWNLPSFAHARLAASVSVMAEASAKALSLAASSCFIFLVWSKLIVNNIPPFVFSLWPGCPVLSWRVPLKNEFLPPDTMSFDGSSKDNWCYAWGSWDFLGTSGYETWTGFELAFWFFRGSGLSTLQLGIFWGGCHKKESGPASRHREGCP